jgi:hypothetical protein
LGNNHSGNPAPELPVRDWRETIRRTTMPTMYTSFDAAKAALEIHGGFLIETSLDGEWWLAADYDDAVDILTWGGGSHDEALQWLITKQAFINNYTVRSCDFIESLEAK